MSFLAGVLVFVYIGLHQVGHLTGVHFTTFAVAHLRKNTRTRSTKLINRTNLAETMATQ